VKVEIQINNSISASARYITWAPSPCRIRVTDPSGVLTPNVTVRLTSVSAANGGAVVFRRGATGPFSSSLSFQLPVSGQSAAFFVVGSFGQPSTNDRDVRIEARMLTTVVGSVRLMVRVRKNANSLTTGERDRFVGALAQLNNQGLGRFADFRDMHDIPTALAQAHGAPAFLPWHRAYLLDLERELQAIDPRAAPPPRRGSCVEDMLRDELRKLVQAPEHMIGKVELSVEAAALASAEAALKATQTAIWRRQAPGSSAPQATMVALDPNTGGVVAIVCGLPYASRGFNFALAKRPSGSLSKVFTSIAAFEAGLTPETTIDQSPITVTTPSGMSWSPQNSHDATGGTTIRHAFAHSVNTAYVRLTVEVGVDAAIAVAHRMGITTPLLETPMFPLGVSDVKPIEMVAAVARIGNGGFLVDPWLIRCVRGRDGRVMYERPVQAGARVLDSSTVTAMNDLLRAVVDSGTGKIIRELGVTEPFGGKTGTTTGGTNVWFAGVSSSLAIVTWFGYPRPKPMGDEITGGGFAAAAVARFLLARRSAEPIRATARR
jgi:hypothetical protein